MRGIFLAIALVLAAAMPVAAQEERVWIQIAARSSLDDALSVLRARQRNLDGLKGMRMRTGWYAVVLGPFSAATGQAELTRLVAQSRIPADSYITRRDDYRRQFWPTGLSSLRRNAPLADRQPGSMALPARAPVAEPVPEPAAAPDPVETAQAATLAQAAAPSVGMDLDETPAQARASERALGPAARKDLQRAMAWFGFYRSAIDGDFGPGTRRAMSDWQAAQGFDPTGVLTARQRGVILAAFRSDLTALGLERVENTDAGIALQMPKGVVRYEGTDAPFVRYKGEGDDPARVVLISQPGDGDRLKALYEVLQTLDIVPQGARARISGSSFVIDGATEIAATHIEAALYGDTVKGFALVWPKSAPGDVARIAEAMAADFEAIDGEVLAEDAGDAEAQDVDLFAGLEIRRPEWTRSGVFVDDTGQAVTLSQGLDGCGKVTLGGEIEATVQALPGENGLALITPLSPAAPLRAALFRTSPGRIGSGVTVGLYPHGGRMGAPSTSFGALGDIRSPGGDASGIRLTMASALGDTGGPILDEGGALLGIVADRDENGVTPPPGTVHGVGSAVITQALGAAGIAWSPASLTASLPREDLAEAASDMTALVSCWQ